ncbi:MAG TPA: glycosyltransferase [Chitinophagaceae bacterium]|nr:glycosyltransferase [Chitinophagaceae bacterium]
MIIVHIVEPFAAGIAVFVKSLTEAMPDDMHIVVHGERKKEMTASEVKKDFPSQNVRFIKWRSAQRSIDPLKDLFALTELYKILRRLKNKNLVDAVHLHSSKSGLLGRAACKMAGITNVFYTPNGASFLSARNRVTRFLYRQIERLGNRLGGNVVCCSASELEQYLELGIDAGYINNGIDINTGKNAVEKDRSATFRIVTSGRIEKQKNPALFNEIATYFEDLEQIEFIWIGDGKDKKVFTAKNITVTGWVDTKEVHDYVSGSDLYLSTSKYEGLSFAALEALALQKPVLLSNCTGNTDIVKQGINGDLFNTASEAIVKILQYNNNREMLDIMGKFSAEICKTEFNVKENFKKYRELYAGAIGKVAGGKMKWSFGY